MLAWECLLDPGWGEQTKGKLRDHFHDDSQLVAFDFPDLTRAFLNLSDKDFNNTLASTPRLAIDATDSTGRTTLAWAASQGNGDTVKALLACGADPNHKDTAGLTPLHHSLYASSPECMRLLLNAKADVDITTNDGKTALGITVTLQDETAFSELLLSHNVDVECTDKRDWTPLRLAADRDHPNQVSLLLGKGANINASGSNGKTAFHLAITSGSSDVVKILLNDSALDYKLKLDDGRTAIHLAATFSDLETLKILKAADLTNIDLDAVDADGDTALDCARWRRNHNEAWANWMIEPRDEDPEAWYETFKELINSIRVSQGKDVLGDSESECSTSPRKTSDSDVSEGSGSQQDEEEEEEEGYDTAEEDHESSAASESAREQTSQEIQERPKGGGLGLEAEKGERHLGKGHSD